MRENAAMASPNFSDPVLLEGITGHLNQGIVGLLYFDLSRSSELEKKYGMSFIPMVIEMAKQAILHFHDDDRTVIFSQIIENDFFLYIFLKETEDGQASFKLHEWAIQIRGHMESHVNRNIWVHETLTFTAGSSVILNHSDKPLDSIVYAAAKQAIKQANEELFNPEYESKLSEFQNIIERQAIRPVYQPIISLSDAQVFGYEALSRGPENSVFHSPLELFRFAEREGDLYRLDTIARQKAVQGLQGSNLARKVFINIPAQIIHDPEFTSGQTRKMIESYGLDPHQIVFEITERSSIEDFSTAKKILSHYRNQGYQIAIDDAGAGYSSLLAIAELQPGYIKIERSLVHNNHRDKLKETVLETFVTFAQKLNIPLIAEGIEEPEDLMKLMRMGVQYGQGYLLGRPTVGLQETNKQANEWIQTQNRRNPYSGNNWTIGDLAQPIVQLDCRTNVSEVWNFFEQNRQQLGIVITRGDEPIGLIMREKLYWQLAEQYGLDLYWNRPVMKIMDQHPLIVDDHLPVEQISQMAMAREYDKLYDFVIIRRNGRMHGVASVRSILKCITNIRTENARVSNPLTGLPGNIRIQRELSRRLLEEESFCVIYADLDYFKWYNDKFGFHRGDDLIQYTAEVLLQSVTVSGDNQDLIGHIGGDDFIVVSTTAKPEELCREIIRRFESGIESFYGEEEWKEIWDREGNRIESDGISISLSLVICLGPCGLSVEELSRIAANLKKKAKKHIGSAFYCEKLGGASEIKS